MTAHENLANLLKTDDAEQAATDLIEWYNVREEYLTSYDLRRLADLHNDGNFKAWDCPTCEERVYEGTPDDWGHFQGVCQVDYTSYPGGVREQCDYCRCHNPLTKKEFKELN